LASCRLQKTSFPSFSQPHLRIDRWLPLMAVVIAQPLGQRKQAF
jgi:hypothetical protein